MPRRFIARIYRVLERGNLDMALSLCESRPGPLTRILSIGIINRNLPKDDLQVILDVNVRLERTKIQKHLSSLAFIGGIAVIIGLLGTVVGVFISIGSVYRTDGPDTTVRVATGISYALLTTASGLAVALPAMVGFAYFRAKADSMIGEMIRHSLSLVRFFTTGSSQLVEQEAEQGEDE
jgi:biopolymer transport protein ExbB